MCTVSNSNQTNKLCFWHSIVVCLTSLELVSTALFVMRSTFVQIASQPVSQETSIPRTMATTHLTSWLRYIIWLYSFSHILLIFHQIPYPLENTEVKTASKTAVNLWTGRDASNVMRSPVSKPSSVYSAGGTVLGSGVKHRSDEEREDDHHENCNGCNHVRWAPFEICCVLIRLTCPSAAYLWNSVPMWILPFFADVLQLGSLAYVTSISTLYWYLDSYTVLSLWS